MVGMRNFQDTFKTRKRSFISTFSICKAVPLRPLYHNKNTVFNQWYHYKALHGLLLASNYKIHAGKLSTFTFLMTLQSVFYWQFLTTYIFSVSLKFGACYITVNLIQRRPIKNDCLTASDLFHMFTQSIKFYTFHYRVLRVQMFEKCNSSNRK